MTETVDGKMMTNEFLGSLAVVYFMTSMAVGTSGVTNAMAAGLVLAVMMMSASMEGGELARQVAPLLGTSGSPTGVGATPERVP